MRILMVEDDKLFGGAMQKSLLRAGYAVDWIELGRDLVGAMRAAEYDCVLLDLNLPDASGEECLKTIRELFTPSEQEQILGGNLRRELGL